MGHVARAEGCVPAGGDTRCGASLPITSLEVKVAPALQGTVVVMAGKKRPWKCAQQAWLCQDGLIPVVSHLAPSGLNCPGLLGLILVRSCSCAWPRCGRAPSVGRRLVGRERDAGGGEPAWKWCWAEAWRQLSFQVHFEVCWKARGSWPWLCSCWSQAQTHLSAGGRGNVDPAAVSAPTDAFAAAVCWSQHPRCPYNFSSASIISVYDDAVFNNTITYCFSTGTCSFRKKKKKDVVLQDDSERGSKSSR